MYEVIHHILVLYIPVCHIPAFQTIPPTRWLCLSTHDALGGEPGVRSARYSGQGDEANNDLLLRNLQGVEGAKRSARYRVVLALVDPNASPGAPGGRAIPVTTEGICEGVIADSPAGDNGFGYDPLFYVHGYARTMAQLSAEEKDSISHRGAAARSMVAVLKRIAGDPV